MKIKAALWDFSTAPRALGTIRPTDTPLGSLHPGDPQQRCEVQSLKLKWIHVKSDKYTAQHIKVYIFNKRIEYTFFMADIHGNMSSTGLEHLLNLCLTVLQYWGLRGGSESLTECWSVLSAVLSVMWRGQGIQEIFPLSSDFIMLEAYLLCLWPPGGQCEVAICSETP